MKTLQEFINEEIEKVQLGTGLLETIRLNSDLGKEIIRNASANYLASLPQSTGVSAGEEGGLEVVNGTLGLSKLILESLGEYVNGLGRRNLGLPMMDEVAVMQMEYIIDQLLENPNELPDIPEYH